MTESLSRDLGIVLEWDDDADKYVGATMHGRFEYSFVAKGMVEGVTTYDTVVRFDGVSRKLKLGVCPTGLLSASNARGARAVITGDRAFDRRYMAEAESTQLAVEVLDAPTRRWLLSQRPATLLIGSGTFSFQKTGRLDNIADVRDVVSNLSRLFKRLADIAKTEAYRDM